MISYRKSWLNPPWNISYPKQTLLRPPIKNRWTFNIFNWFPTRSFHEVQLKLAKFLNVCCALFNGANASLNICAAKNCQEIWCSWTSPSYFRYTLFMINPRFSTELMSGNLQTTNEIHLLKKKTLGRTVNKICLHQWK